MRPYSNVERYLPTIYFAVAAVLIAALLPTTLRPPQPPPPSAAEFSPDAPPDEEHEVILSELSRGTTATAGVGEEVAVGADGPGALLEPVEELVPRRGLCFGDPPRQVESFYAPPCAPAWTGQNPGATHRGVTATEVRIGILRGEGYEGPVREEPFDGESAEERTYRVYQAYFNQNFELYGRQIRFYFANTGEAEDTRAAVGKLDEEFQVFGLIHTDVGAAEDEAIRRGLVVYGSISNNEEFFRKNNPLAYSFHMDGTKHIQLFAEMLCKQLWGEPVSFSGDLSMRGQERKYGALVYDDVTHFGYLDELRHEFAKCGGEVHEHQHYNYGDGADEGLQTMTKFRALGVTTVLMLTSWFAPVIATTQATQHGYYPEWAHPGAGGITVNAAAQLYERTQWRNSIGLAAGEMARPTHEQDWYRAYKSIDPDNEPDGALNFHNMLQFVGGIQLAGPELNPWTFQEGLQRQWPSRPPDPIWSIGGGYRPGDWTYPDYVALIWWDPTGNEPNSSSPGAYCHVYGGQRYTFGEIPTEPIPWFSDGISHPEDTGC